MLESTSTTLAPSVVQIDFSEFAWTRAESFSSPTLTGKESFEQFREMIELVGAMSPALATV